jgi:hypothetical protein
MTINTKTEQINIIEKAGFIAYLRKHSFENIDRQC